MDVSCSRCRAEYEFDDALISDKGTQVYCTGCGFQFKVFPNELGVRPEEWVLTRGAAGGKRTVFHSLRELQRAIARGEVLGTDLLARGDAAARSVDTIVELEPLLRKPRTLAPSALPGSPAESSIPPIQALDAAFPASALRRAPTGTVMGLAAPRVPVFQAAAPPQSLPPVLAAEAPDADDAYVPSSPPEEPDLRAPRADARPQLGVERPRIRSMLSTHAAPASEVWDAAPRPDLTPTPPPNRQRPTFESEPMSAIPPTRRGQGARGVWLVLAVLLGTGAFVLTVARDKVRRVLSPQRTSLTAEQVTPPALGITEAAVELADEAWMRVQLAEPGAEPIAQAAFEARLLAAERELFELKRLRAKSAPSDRQVLLESQLLRMKGEVPAARALLAARPEVVDDAYTEAMLDLVDPSAERPFPVIIRRLKQAATGERGRYRARSAYIYALSLAGRREQAQTDLEVLSQLEGGASAPLFSALEAFLAREPSAAAPPEALP